MRSMKRQKGKHMSNRMDDLRQVIEKASAKIDAAYWAACDAAKAAIDPADMTDEQWAIDLLAESYEIAMRVEGDPHGWYEGRSKW